MKMFCFFVFQRIKLIAKNPTHVLTSQKAKLVLTNTNPEKMVLRQDFKIRTKARGRKMAQNTSDALETFLDIKY